MFTPVSREQNRLRLAIDGPPGSGKTYTALRLAFALAGPTGRVAVLDTEHNSASKYEGEAPDGIPWKWDGCALQHFAPSAYEQATIYAGRSGYDVLVIDSLSHAWVGVGGALDQVDRANEKSTFFAWRNVTPQHNAMIEAIIRSPCHVIVTLRSKMEYVIEEDEKGKKVPRKIGLKPVQREGVEYEFDIIGDIDIAHTMVVSKSRCSAIDGKSFHKPDASFIQPVKKWLFSGIARAAAAPVQELGPAVTGVANGNGGILLDGDVPRCDEVLAGEIKGLAKELGWGPDRLRELLGKRGASRLADLTRDAALGLATRLREKTLEQGGKEAF